MDNVIIFIFSYNRGPHLKNCVESIERCASSAEVVVYDDASNDPETQAILQDIARRHEVRIIHDKKSVNAHGSLYTNMQHAISSIEDDKIIFFLQDDTQLIREIRPDDIAFIENYFSNFSDTGFLAPVFQKKIVRKKVLDRFLYNHEKKVYFCEHVSKKEVAGTYYSDISITTSKRLKEVDWKFYSGEYENEVQAKKSFTKMGYMYAPLAMWLPNAPAYRNKKKGRVFAFAEKINKAGLYPYRDMTESEVETMCERPVNALPIAENHLSIRDKHLTMPWIFHPLHRSRVLRRLEKIENSLKRIFK